MSAIEIFQRKIDFYLRFVRDKEKYKLFVAKDLFVDLRNHGLIDKEDLDYKYRGVWIWGIEGGEMVMRKNCMGNTIIDEEKKYWNDATRFYKYIVATVTTGLVLYGPDIPENIPVGYLDNVVDVKIDHEKKVVLYYVIYG